jgi:hypothetical protein
MEARYNAEEWDTCLLDVLGPPDEFGQSEVIDDTRAGNLLGLSHERVAQVIANAAFKFRKAYALEAQSLEMTEAARAAERVKLKRSDCGD